MYEFRFVEQVRGEKKRFNGKISDVERELKHNGYHELDFYHYVNSGTPLALKLNLSAKSEHQTSWAASIKLNGIRIDCIDHESRFRSMDGSIGHGWHRHEWDRASKNADRIKSPLPEFDNGGLDIHMFMIRVANVFRIRFK